MKKPGRLRASLLRPDLAMISFSVSPQYATAEQIRKAAPIFGKKHGMASTEVASLRVAGQDLYCFEQTWNNGKAAELTRRDPVIDLMCAPLSDKRQFFASYFGSRALVPEFYKMLSTVKQK